MAARGLGMWWVNYQMIGNSNKAMIRFNRTGLTLDLLIFQINPSILLCCKISITFSLKSGILFTSDPSMLNIANALSLDCPMVLRKNVFIRFKVEKHLSLSTVVIGIVHKMFNN